MLLIARVQKMTINQCTALPFISLRIDYLEFVLKVDQSSSIGCSLELKIWPINVIVWHIVA